MKIATKGVLTSVLMLGLMSVACAQSANLGVNGANGANGLNGAGGLQAGGANGAGQAMSPGTGVASPSPTPGLGTAGSPPAIGGTGGTGSVGSGPVLNNMRANGTSLNMSPNPRAPNVTGRAFGQ